MTVACESDEIEFLDDELTRVEQESKDRDTDIVSALNSAVDALNAAIKTEADIRAAQIQGIAELLQATKATLTAMIAAEELARIKGDADLAADLKSNIEMLQAALALEESARIAGDEANADAIAEAVTELSAAIGAESQARKRGDAELAAALGDAVDTINESITAEIDARVEGDQANEDFIKKVRKRLNRNIDRAEQAAIDGDSATLAEANSIIQEVNGNLQSAIDGVSENLVALENNILDAIDVVAAGYPNRSITTMSDVVAIILAEASEQNGIQADVAVLLGNLETIKLQLNDVTDGHDELKAQVDELIAALTEQSTNCLLYTSPSPRDS